MLCPLWRAREGVRMGNALASDGARMVHFILSLVLDLGLLVDNQQTELRSDRLLVPFRVHEDVSSRAYCPSLTDGSGLTQTCAAPLCWVAVLTTTFSFLHVTFQLLATSRVCTIFRSLSYFQSASSLSRMFVPGCFGGLSPWCLGYPLRKSTIQTLGRPMGSQQRILCWMIHAGPRSGHNISPSIVPTAKVTLQSRG